MIHRTMEKSIMEYGIQLYSVRDITETNMEGALKALSEMGYKSVEFAGFFGISPERIGDLLAKYGLSVSGTHTSLDEIVAHYEETVAYHKAIGNKRIIVPGHDLSTREKLDEFIDLMNTYAARLAAEGITLGYHNHDHEFFPNEDGQIIYDEILSRTDIALEVDTYWVYAAKKDPVILMERLKDRLPVIHIKDGLENGEGKPLGMGTAPVAAVYRKAVELGIPMVVESETLDPDGLTEARICIDYLKSLE